MDKNCRSPRLSTAIPDRKLPVVLVAAALQCRGRSAAQNRHTEPEGLHQCPWIKPDPFRSLTPTCSSPAASSLFHSPAPECSTSSVPARRTSSASTSSAATPRLEVKDRGVISAFDVADINSIRMEGFSGADRLEISNANGAVKLASACTAGRGTTRCSAGARATACTAPPAMTTSPAPAGTTSATAKRAPTRYRRERKGLSRRRRRSRQHPGQRRQRPPLWANRQRHPAGQHRQ